MPRKRIIDPDFWVDEIIGKLDFKTMLLYIGLWNLADSEGIIEDSEEKIRVQLFPYKKHTKITKSIKALIDFGKLIPYEVDGKKYLLIKNFKKWQKESHPTYKYPKPPQFQKSSEDSRKVWKPPE